MLQEMQDLKTFNKDGASLEELVELSAFARSYKGECSELNVEAPNWFDAQVSALRREIALRVEAQKESRRKKIQAELKGLRTAEERRQELQQELASLEPSNV